MLERVPRLYEVADGFGTWDVEEHRGICLAVRDGDGERAAARMRDHVLAIGSIYDGLDAG
jgi:DNA-binding GntR family transcriptional regulator